jgi:RecA/RadA recombinase
MSTLVERILKNSKIKETAAIRESKVFGKKDMIPTSVPMVNVALSGRIDGGLTPGLLMLAGPSKHFKSAFALMMAASFQKKHPDGVVLFYDSEFGSPESYFESFGIDMDRVVHSPITDIEVLKFDIMAQLDQFDKKDNVMILVDSIGNLASKKEVDDALDGKSVADMTRAKSNKSLGRLITPHLHLKDIPMVVVNHTYKEIGMFPKDIVSGGTGLYYSADAIWIIGRRQEKEGTEVKGYHFVINIEKSRHVREKSAIPISVTFEGGIAKWSGLMEVALEGGYLRKPKVGWYEAVDPETGEVLTDKMMRAKEVASSKELWLMLFEKTNLATYIKNEYTVANGNLFQEDESGEDEPEETEEV